MITWGRRNRKSPYLWRVLARHRLATAAAQQSTNVREKSQADYLIATIDFQSSDAAGDHDMYRQIITRLQTPQNVSVPPVIRDRLIVNAELQWVNDEFFFAKNRQGAMVHLDNATQILNQISQDRVTAQMTNLSNLAKTVDTGCSEPAQASSGLIA
jgi:hypothetical protein